mmetsp:Transcript_19383/g.49797  ORF Transcript_19383/g.49797 Transcript_19383/m.49797 type:complete len:302 (+) Transcript_19383:523-1428(+)
MEWRLAAARTALVRVGTPAQEVLHHQALARPAAQVQRGHAILVLGLDKRAAVQQQLHDLPVATQRCEVQWGQACPVFGIDVRAAVNELIHGVEVAVLRSEVDGRALPPVNGLHMRAAAQQLHGRFGVALLHSPVQGALAILVHRVDVGPAVHEAPDGAVLAALRRQQQWRHAKVVLVLHVRAQVDELLRGAHLATPGCPVKRRFARLVLHHERTPVGLHNHARHRGMAHPGGHVQRPLAGLGARAAVAASLQQHFHNFLVPRPCRQVVRRLPQVVGSVQVARGGDEVRQRLAVRAALDGGV